MTLKTKALLWTVVIMIGLGFLLFSIGNFEYVRTVMGHIIILILSIMVLIIIGSSIYDGVLEGLEFLEFEKRINEKSRMLQDEKKRINELKEEK